ncbi:hypothetical protein M405DRAFT_384884 [Rhizopogon salebrosus TDB-379]|nr:hypothetical protein M405DRAFT_384884 [Rhizopogon salebrosus TDB-379]
MGCRGIKVCVCRSIYGSLAYSMPSQRSVRCGSTCLTCSIAASVIHGFCMGSIWYLTQTVLSCLHKWLFRCVVKSIRTSKQVSVHSSWIASLNHPAAFDAWHYTPTSSLRSDPPFSQFSPAAEGFKSQKTLWFFG